MADPTPSKAIHQQHASLKGGAVQADETAMLNKASLLAAEAGENYDPAATKAGRNTAGKRYTATATMPNQAPKP